MRKFNIIDMGFWFSLAALTAMVVVACATQPDTSSQGQCPALTPYSTLERGVLADDVTAVATAHPEIVAALSDYRKRRAEIRKCLGQPATLAF